MRSGRCWAGLPRTRQWGRPGQGQIIRAAASLARRAAPGEEARRLRGRAGPRDAWRKARGGGARPWVGACASVVVMDLSFHYLPAIECAAMSQLRDRVGRAPPGLAARERATAMPVLRARGPATCRRDPHCTPPPRLRASLLLSCANTRLTGGPRGARPGSPAQPAPLTFPRNCPICPSRGVPCRVSRSGPQRSVDYGNLDPMVPPHARGRRG